MKSQSLYLSALLGFAGLSAGATPIPTNCLTSGIALGCVYALVALGFVLIYKATEVVNFAQGEPPSARRPSARPGRRGSA